jgi:hypothetical protein
MLSPSAPAEEVCPVGDELLADMYKADESQLHDLVATVVPEITASLALFCYRRSHPHDRGLAIAASCDEGDLVRIEGHWRNSVRKVQKSADAERRAPLRRPRMITLATGPLRTFAPDDEPDEEAS